MRELEMRIAHQLVPQEMHAEAVTPFSGVVKQHDAAARELRQPRFEIAPDGIMGVTAIDMEHVDRPVGELIAGLREGRANYPGKSVVAAIAPRHVLIDVVAVEASVFVAFKAVDRKAARLELEPPHGLAEHEIGKSVMDAEFHDRFRP